MSFIYNSARQAFLSGTPTTIDWDTDEIRVALVLTTYAPLSSSTDIYVSAIAASIVTNGRSSAFGTKTVANGVAGAANVTITAPTGGACNLVVYKYTGNDATSPLIAWINTGTGIPVTANGGDITINWDAVNKIFTL
jgi:hypothetical protein